MYIYAQSSLTHFAVWHIQQRCRSYRHCLGNTEQHYTGCHLFLKLSKGWSMFYIQQYICVLYSAVTKMHM